MLVRFYYTVAKSTRVFSLLLAAEGGREGGREFEELAIERFHERERERERGERERERERGEVSRVGCFGGQHGAVNVSALQERERQGMDGLNSAVERTITAHW